MDNNTIVVTDELGNEVEYEILFTFENEENGHKYVVYFDPEKDEPEAQAAIYDEEGGLFPIETPEDLLKKCSNLLFQKKMKQNTVKEKMKIVIHKS